MNPPLINSTSSVSTTRRKREAERSVNWTVEETQVLLCAWSDERVQKSLAENLRNRHVFKHLSARMSEMGFSRSPHQCRLRVKTLKANYVRAKLQRGVDGPHLCTFKYFAEMDAVLGRRSQPPSGFPSQRPTVALISEGGLGRRPPEHPAANGRAGSSSPEEEDEEEEEVKGGRSSSWLLEAEVKLENREESTDEYDFSDTGFPQQQQQHQQQQQLRDRRQDAQPDSPLHTGPPPLHRSAGESSLSAFVGAPPAPTPLPPPPAPPPPPPPPPIPSLPYQHVFASSPGPPPEPSCLEPVLKHLSECFQQLVSEARGLLVQLESQRQEQARWHQELLAQWLQREERRQRDAAEREERRERARMEHEIRVLELLTRLAQQQQQQQQQQQGCKCGGGSTAAEAPPTSTPNRNKDGS